MKLISYTPSGREAQRAVLLVAVEKFDQGIYAVARVGVREAEHLKAARCAVVFAHVSYHYAVVVGIDIEHAERRPERTAPLGLRESVA